MRYSLTFKKGRILIAKVSGWRDVKLSEIPALIEPAGISALERQLEVMTGYRCHIEEDHSTLS